MVMHRTTIVACFIVHRVIQFDKYFYPVALYENYLVCIFMNINEILKMREIPLDELASKEVIRPTLNT